MAFALSVVACIVVAFLSLITAYMLLVSSKVTSGGLGAAIVEGVFMSVNVVLVPFVALLYIDDEDEPAAHMLLAAIPDHLRGHYLCKVLLYVFVDASPLAISALLSQELYRHSCV